jgi:flagellar FliJ protein
LPRFVFELEPVLEQRRREEQARQRALAQLELERAALEGEIRSCQNAIDQERADLRDLLAGGATVDLQSARMQANASLHHMTRAQRAVLRLAGVHQRLTHAREALLEATKRRKAVETLKERRYEAWKREQDAAEARELDDLSVMRFGRETMP